MKNYILLISVSLLFTFCKEQPRTKKKETYQFTKIITTGKNVKIPIDENVHYRSWQIHVLEENDSVYLYRKNYYKNSIEVFNWQTKQKIHTYAFKQKGPSKVSKFDSAAYLRLKDSLFIIGTGRSIVYLLEQDSVIYKKSFDQTGKGWGVIMNGFNKCLPVQVKNSVYMRRSSPFLRIEDNYYTAKLLVKFDVDNKRLDECNVYYPNSYKANECWSFKCLKPSFTLNNKGQLIFSFPIDHSLYVYDIKKDTFLKIEQNTESFFNPVFIPMQCKSFSDDRNKYYYYEKKTARYEAIKYDKYKDIYYRIVLFPPDNLNKKNALEVDMEMSIMVLDSEFNVIAENMFEAGKYDYEDFFVTKEGLWISTNNPLNPDFDEDVMSFDLFILEDKK